jgi:hypothetical protein
MHSVVFFHMPSKDDGKHRSILFQDYAAATKHYAWAVGELNRQRALLPKEHYKEMYKVAEDAREDCERLRKAILELAARA